jgi:serine/threonine-protein phosphatase with EF-hand domain
MIFDKKNSFIKDFLFRVTLFEDPAYHSLIEKIMTNRSGLLKEFEKADANKTDHLTLTIWAEIMSDVLQIDLPWLILRAKLVQEDEKGVLYRTMFDDYILDNSKFQMVRTLLFYHSVFHCL